MLLRIRQTWRDAGPEKFAVLAGALAFAIAVGIFFVMADEAAPGRYLALESGILRAFRHSDDLALGIGPAWLPSMVRDITALGSVAVLTLLVAIVTGFLFLRGRRRAALLLVVATVGGTTLGGGIKAAFDRPRPTIVPHLMDATSFSFPSGHSMMSSVVYLTMAALLAQTVARPREKIYLVLAAAFVTGLTGVSRIYLGVHYPSDVVAGWCAGLAWALFCWAVAAWLQRRGKLRGPDSAGGDPR